MKIKSLLAQALIVGLIPVSVNAQKKASIDWYGFVAAQSWFNTHNSNAGADGFLYLYPLDQNLDANGNDLNAYAHGSWFGTMARLGWVLNGPEIFGAASRAKVEIEFSGHNASGLLYRHAFIALDWTQSSLTLGHTWHPMNDLFPSTVSIAIGSPFNPLIRTPQLRYEYWLDSDKKTKLTAAAIFQAMNKSNGPVGGSLNYQRNAVLPMLYAGADFTLGDIKLGAGLEYQRIVPLIDPADGKKYYLNGLTGMIQAQYSKDKLSVKGKALLGQNMSHMGICSGYGLTSFTDREYIPLSALSTWAQVQYGSDVKFGVWGGFMKNLGATDDLVAVYATGGGNIDNMWRVSPNVMYSVGNMVLGCEYELTTVAYGTLQAKGTVSDTHNVMNHRLLLSVMYNF